MHWVAKHGQSRGGSRCLIQNPTSWPRDPSGRRISSCVELSEPGMRSGSRRSFQMAKRSGGITHGRRATSRRFATQRPFCMEGSGVGPPLGTSRTGVPRLLATLHSHPILIQLMPQLLRNACKTPTVRVRLPCGCAQQSLLHCPPPPPTQRKACSFPFTFTCEGTVTCFIP